ncbi:TetR/AcrR family transcriptional regulator [Streptomyces sp. NBC_01340]|jgi:AcrR family transcriptional regulator|uniref:TetR/AcrR family transcriptional regulator n=1 Tax=unclassified Streptomyces TaxID=2593676 RepID=UPI002252860B|nr:MULTISPECIES: TetR/AcrR family transcriptional regulator [unclassified Streptomyces]MCX4452237.1 TetR/AcrR family transcriptional regulator [Streptomyces sp. NBC_01719]MCX4491597.1 TetR/AcrR family transcriptional regulator [Streptomyces sp. NBC_01728]MCX4593832.1 TetR/AcrR family transcriptional regulator [Streptomyces sp. NBC_01549]WSI44013.1 TetR/AcrR family transcriptional regulator [Streptomyces sp. NBC_01340]
MAASDRRAELLEAAIRVMARDGVAKATTRAIVNEAGMTLGAFHYCFDSRAQLLERVTETLTERYVAEVRGLFAPHKDIRESVLDSLHAFWKGFEANPGEHQISYELTQYALRNPGFENIARRQYEIFLAAFASLLELAADNAGIEWTQPVPILARYVHSVIDGLNMTWLVDRNSDHSQAVLHLLADHLLQYARPRTA